MDRLESGLTLILKTPVMMMMMIIIIIISNPNRNKICSV